jgi:4-amino-4-deoxy-L-arabinose transferase-like glycosyltransferase
VEKLKSFAKEFKLEITFFFTLFIMLFIGAGRFPFLDPDSYQWLEKSFEIFRLDNWLTHSQWFGKPPLMIWLTALSAKIFGLNLFSLKVANLLISWLSVLCVYLLAKEMFNRNIARWATIIYAVSPSFLFLKFSHKMDVPVVLFMAAAFYFFFVFKRTGKPVNIYLFWASCFAGFMVKAVYAFYPVILIPLVSYITKDEEAIKQLKGTLLHQAAAVCLMLLLIAPWFIAQYMTHGRSFLKFQYVEFIGRLLFKSGNVGSRDNNFWQYTTDTFLTFLPWSIFIGPAIAATWKRAKGDFKLQLLYWWFLPPLIAFSLSGELKVVRYLMFVFPAIAMILAYYFENMEITKRLKIWAVSASSVLFALAAAIVVAATRSGDAFVRELVPLLGPFLIIFFLGLLASSILLVYKGKRALVFLGGTTSGSFILLMFLAFFMLNSYYPRLEVSRELADRITLNKQVIIVDMDFADYIYIGGNLALLEDIGAENVKSGDYVASSKEFDVVKKTLGKEINIVFAKDVEYKSGREVLPYRLFRVR